MSSLKLNSQRLTPEAILNKTNIADQKKRLQEFVLICDGSKLIIEQKRDNSQLSLNYIDLDILTHVSNADT